MAIFKSNKELNYIAFDQVAELLIKNAMEQEFEDIRKEVRLSDITAVNLNEIENACSKFGHINIDEELEHKKIKINVEKEMNHDPFFVSQ